MSRWEIWIFKFETKKSISECEFYIVTLMLHLVENVLNPNTEGGRMANGNTVVSLEVYICGECSDGEPAGIGRRCREITAELQNKVT